MFYLETWEALKALSANLVSSMLLTMLLSYPNDALNLKASSSYWNRERTIDSQWQIERVI